MRDDIIVVNPAGLDKGGSETLGRQFAELLDCPVVFRLRPKEDYEESGRVHYFRENEDLDRYNPKLAIINLFDVRKNWFVSKKPEDFVQYFKDRNIKTAFVYCIRSNQARAVLEGNRYLIENCDYVLYYSDSLEDIIEPLNKNTIKTDINIYNFHEDIKPLPLSKRSKIVTTSGRPESIKALPRFLKNLKENISNDIFKELYFVHQGASFKYSRSGKISGAMSIVNLLYNNDLKNKVLDPAFNPVEKEFELTDKLQHNKINLFQQYNKDNTKDIWPKMLVNIYPALGKIKADDGSKKEERYINRHKKYWSKAMEYVQLEMIDYGVPVLFSKEFLKTYEFGKDLLELDFSYEFYEDIPDILSDILKDKDKYEHIVTKQKEIMTRAQEEINNNFKELINDLAK